MSHSRDAYLKRKGIIYMYRVNNWKERHFDNIYKKKATKSVLNLYNRTIPKPRTNGFLCSTDSFQWDSVPLTHELEKNKRKVSDCGLRTVHYLPQTQL